MLAMDVKTYIIAVHGYAFASGIPLSAIDQKTSPSPDARKLHQSHGFAINAKITLTPGKR